MANLPPDQLDNSNSCSNYGCYSYCYFACYLFKLLLYQDSSVHCASINALTTRCA